MVEVVLAVYAVIFALTGMTAIAWYGRKDGLLGDGDIVGRLFLVISAFLGLGSFILYIMT